MPAGCNAGLTVRWHGQWMAAWMMHRGIIFSSHFWLWFWLLEVATDLTFTFTTVGQKSKLAYTWRHGADPLCRRIADEYRTSSESVAVVALVMARVAVGDIRVGTRHARVGHFHLSWAGHVETSRVLDLRQCRTHDRPYTTNTKTRKRRRPSTDILCDHQPDIWLFMLVHWSLLLWGTFTSFLVFLYTPLCFPVMGGRTRNGQTNRQIEGRARRVVRHCGLSGRPHKRVSYCRSIHCAMRLFIYVYVTIVLSGDVMQALR